MSRFALLTLLLSIKALLDGGNTDSAKTLIEEVIAEAKRPDADLSF